MLTIDPPRLGLHHLVGGLRHIERGQQVQRHDPLDEAGRNGRRVRVRRAPALLTSTLSRPNRSTTCSTRWTAAAGVPDVRHDEAGGPAACGRRSGRVGSAAHHHVGARGEERSRDHVPDALGAAGHQHRATGEVHAHAQGLLALSSLTSYCVLTNVRSHGAGDRRHRGHRVRDRANVPRRGRRRGGARQNRPDRSAGRRRQDRLLRHGGRPGARRPPSIWWSRSSSGSGGSERLLVNNAGGSPDAERGDRFPPPPVRRAGRGAEPARPVTTWRPAGQPGDAGPRTAAGGIINIGSISAVHPQPGTAAYSAAKAGLLTLTKALYRRWSGRRRCGSDHVTAGPMAAAYGEDGGAAVAGAIPMGRPASRGRRRERLPLPGRRRGLPTLSRRADLAVHGGGEFPPGPLPGDAQLTPGSGDGASRGRPRTRSPMMLRWIWFEPP